MAPLVWYQDLIATLRRKELFDVEDGAFNSLTNPIMDLRGALEDLYMIRNNPIPLCYRQLTNFSVRSYMCILLADACLEEVVREDEAGKGRLSRGIYWFILSFAFE